MTVPSIDTLFTSTRITKLVTSMCLALAALSAQAQQLSYNGIKPTAVIDVRTPAEFAAGHIPGAVNIPLERVATDIRTLSSIGKQSPILLYCRSGRRSAAAQKILRRQGFQKVIDGRSMTTLSGQIRICSSKSC